MKNNVATASWPLSQSEGDKQNEDGGSSVVQASGEETRLGHKIHWEKVYILM